jgi:hypothetical protein
MEMIVLVLMYMYFVLISSSRFLGLFHKKEIPELFFFGLGYPVVFFPLDRYGGLIQKVASAFKICALMANSLQQEQIYGVKTAGHS